MTIINSFQQRITPFSMSSRTLPSLSEFLPGFTENNPSALLPPPTSKTKIFYISHPLLHFLPEPRCFKAEPALASGQCKPSFGCPVCLPDKDWVGKSVLLI